MSRIGKKPIVIPKDVTVSVDGRTVAVKGPKGELTRQVHPEMRVALDGETLTVTRPSDVPRHRALHGLTRSLLGNMVQGVTEGFSRRLEIHGVGYRAETMQGGVKLQVGFAHPIEYEAPQGITIAVESPTAVNVHGIDKELVGQVAAELRKVRPPEPYKGKGIRYQGEHVRRKAGKTGG
ncbi:MAG: 50S ribosomal protein L6 [Gemmatimonadales bacterium]|jgi:large subunit ribosomal protein L6